MELRMNKRGHIPTIMLFFGALILVIVTLFSFTNVKNELGGESEDFNILVQEIDFKKKYISAVFEKIVEEAVESTDKLKFEESFSVTFEKISDRRDPKDGSFGNFFGRIRNEKYTINKENGIYTLTIEDVFVSSNVEKNEMKRTFPLSIRFNKEGLIQRN